MRRSKCVEVEWEEQLTVKRVWKHCSDVENYDHTVAELL